MTLFFLHVPRTGGTALRKAFIDALGADKVLSLFTRYGSETSPAARKIIFDERDGHDPQRYDKLSDYIVAKGVGLFASHHSAARLNCFEPRRCFIILRHPVDRIVSEYRYVRHRRHTDMSFDAFISDPRRQNAQSKILAGVKLEDLGAIGLFDHYEDFVHRLNGTYDLSLQVRRENENKLVSRRFLPFCSARITAKIRQANALDLALFEHAQALCGAGPTVQPAGR